MTEVFKQVTLDTFKRWDKDHTDVNEPLELVRETSELLVAIILKCAFG